MNYVFVEDWWSDDDDGKGKDALRRKFVLSDDEDNLEGDGCMEFNEATDMGKIEFEIGMKFANHEIFGQALVEFSVKGGFDIKYIQNDRKRITAKCKAENCKWRIHASVKQGEQTLKIKSLGGGTIHVLDRIRIILLTVDTWPKNICMT